MGQEYASITNQEAVITRGFEEITGLGSLYVVLAYIATLETIGEKITNRILATAIIINSTIIFSIKQIFAAPRPETGQHFLTGSFPSGHAATAFAVAGVIGWRYPKLRYLTLTLATLVAAGRVIIGAHFIEDIIVGAAIGYIIGNLTAWKMEKLIHQGKLFTNLN